MQSFTSYIDREQFILLRAAGKRVLHLGCIGLSGDLPPEVRISISQRSLHAELSRIADVTGVDLSHDVVTELSQREVFNNILVGDVQKLDEIDGLPDSFDLVVAGDIIEHVSNPGLMLEGILKRCHASTEIIVTTPNAFGLPRYLNYLAGRFQDMREHVLAFNPDTLTNIMERHGFTLLETHTCHQTHINKTKLSFILGSRLFKLYPKLGGTLLYVAKPLN